MASRAEDWLRQAQRDLEHARDALARGTYEWAAFAAQQGAEKAVKALFQKLGADARGHSVSQLLSALPVAARPSGELVETAKDLDKHYVTPRYPNSYPQGAPMDFYTRAEAQRAVDGARRSLTTVEVTYFDRDSVRRAVDEHVERLAAQYPELEEVILFGSVAHGIPVPGSDVDLLLVLDHSEHGFLGRIPQFLPGRFPVGVDVFPYTREEIERMTAEGNRFVLDAIRTGIVVFRRGHRRG